MDHRSRMAHLPCWWVCWGCSSPSSRQMKVGAPPCVVDSRDWFGVYPLCRRKWLGVPYILLLRCPFRSLVVSSQSSLWCRTLLASFGDCILSTIGVFSCSLPIGLVRHWYITMLEPTVGRSIQLLRMRSPLVWGGALRSPCWPCTVFWFYVRGPCTPKWSGPHKILRLKGDCNVEILLRHNNKKLITHVNRLKPLLIKLFRIGNVPLVNQKRYISNLTASKLWSLGRWDQSCLPLVYSRIT